MLTQPLIEAAQLHRRPSTALAALKVASQPSQKIEDPGFALFKNVEAACLAIPIEFVGANIGLVGDASQFDFASRALNSWRAA